jgi:DNA-binding response OmpR family regulator
MSCQPAAAPGRRRPRVLVAEDEALVAMFIEAELDDAGYEVIGAFSTYVEASAWLDSDTPDIALLDHTLRDGPCTDIALELRRRGIPFIALTGSDQGELPEAFRDAPYLEKPVDAAFLPRMMARILSAWQAAPSRSSVGDTTASSE